MRVGDVWGREGGAVDSRAMGQRGAVGHGGGMGGIRGGGGIRVRGIRSGGGIRVRGIRSGGCIGHRSGGDGLDDRGGSNSLHSDSLLVDDGVEAVVRVSGVLDDSASAIRLHDRVAALDDVAGPGLLLGLGVSGQAVVDVVRVAVLGVWVVGLLQVDGLGDGGGGGVGERGLGVGQGGDSGAGHGHDGSQNEQLFPTEMQAWLIGLIRAR